MPKEIRNKRPISIPEAMEKLLRRENEAEPSYLQRVALEHAMTFSRVIPMAARFLIKKLQEDYGLKENAAYTIVNVFPEIKEELELVLQNVNVTLSDAKVEEIMELITPFKDSKEDYVRELIIQLGGKPEDTESIISDLEGAKREYEEKLRIEEEQAQVEEESFEPGEDTFDEFLEAEKKPAIDADDPFADEFNLSD